jgi:hypothetical protein
VTSRDLPWAIRVSRAESSEALDRLMDAWSQAVTAGGNLRRSTGFDSDMRLRDWESAKRSIEQIYGRSSREHRQTLDTLSAAIHYKSVLGRRFDSLGLTGTLKKQQET